MIPVTRSSKGQEGCFQPVPIFDHHVHSDSRNADDYEWMALGGTQTVMIPCTAGEPHPGRKLYRARCDRLLRDEVGRAAAYGIDAYIALSIHPGDLVETPVDLDGLLEELRNHLDSSLVRAVGELSLRHDSELEREAFAIQLALAKERRLPVLLESPPDLDQYLAVLPTYLKLIQDSGIDPTLVSFMDMDANKWRPLSGSGFGPAGVAVSPASDALFSLRQKLTDRDVVDLLNEFSSDEFMLNTGFHYGSADPMGLARIAHRLQIRQRMTYTAVRRLVHDTAWSRFIGTTAEI